MMPVSDLWKGLIHLFYPRLCEGCSRPLLQGEDVICIGCESHLSFTNYHAALENETALRLAGRFRFIRAASLACFNEGNLLQHLLHRLKYKDRKRIGAYFGRQIAYAIAESDWKIDAALAVPLHRKKEAKRGFNQSHLIAESLCEVLRIPVLANVVTRVKNTTTQTDKSRMERIDNVKDAFEITNPKALQYKHVLLIDDVITTGATIEACAQELLKTEGLSLSIATVGIAL